MQLQIIKYGQYKQNSENKNHLNELWIGGKKPTDYNQYCGTHDNKWQNNDTTANQGPQQSKEPERHPQQIKKGGAMSEAQSGGVAMSSMEQGDRVMSI